MDLDKQSTIQRIEDLIKKMDIPSNRKRVNLTNLRWLNRNLGVRNSSNPNFEEVMKLVNSAIKNKYYDY